VVEITKYFCVSIFRRGTTWNQKNNLWRSKLDSFRAGSSGGDISGAKCSEESEYIRRTDETRIASFDLNQDENTLVGLRHFHIYLCPPSGEIGIIARDFVEI
jgi:hypothetical protein